MRASLSAELVIKNISSSHPLQPSTCEAYDEHDWALLEISNGHFGVNGIQLHKNGTKYLFIHGCQSYMEDGVELWVVTGRGLLKAYSSAGSATVVNFFGSIVSQKVWSIQLFEPLGEYSSIYLPCIYYL